MKKILAVLLATMLVFTFGVTAMAESSSVDDNSFVQSPAVDDEIILIDAQLPGSAAAFELFVTSYANKANLTDEQEAVFTAAYNALVKAADLSSLISNIGEVLGVASDKLAVGTVFFAHVQQMSRVAATGEYVIEVKCDGLDKFAGLINYSGDAWSVVESAKINNAGNLVFTTESLDAFAILLDVSEEDTTTSDVETPAPDSSTDTDAPETGDDFPWLVVILGVVAVIGIVVIAVTGKKKR